MHIQYYVTRVNDCIDEIATSAYGLSTKRRALEDVREYLDLVISEIASQLIAETWADTSDEEGR